MYCLQQPILAEIQVCCSKGKHALAKVTAIVQSCTASFAKMGQCQEGRIFNILAVYIYCYYVVAYVGFFMYAAPLNVSKRMYILTPSTPQ